ncbi:MAG: ATP-binding cassette domain-containing protein [Owenweeksia sp.]|nr:ATP-binding cassette domain-containing protein [Owenweeksia sp.]
MLKIQDLSKYYGRTAALQGINLEVKRGSIFGLLGPNGAGKTTLIRLINRITAPDQGKIYFNGHLLGPRDVAHIGYLPEERGLYPKMKVGEQLIYLARLKDIPKKEAENRIRSWMSRFKIEDWWSKSIEELSKGMAQKVQFISTVVHQPVLLIFDEPFTGFDPVNTELIKQEIKRLRDEGSSVIFSTHRMESVEEICDEMALIHQGQNILEGPIDQVKEAYKNNEYKAVLANFRQPISLEQGEILQLTEHHQKLHLHVAAAGSNPNLLATELMQYGQLISFKERLPSLSEIFIQKVQS